MKTIIRTLKTPLALAIALFIVSGCATTKAPQGAVNVRQKLTQLQANPELATRAPIAIQAADNAVREAEVPTKDKALSSHLILMADRKVDTAYSLAQKRLLEDQRKSLSEDSANARLDSRTREADQAHMEANVAKQQADQARQQADQSKQQADELQRQIAELNAKATDRGLVVTLGDLLFDSGKSVLKSGANIHLAKLSTFLNKYPDRTVIIEGHTDSVGADEYNQSLSQRRADAVRMFLVSQGINSSRIMASGKGESTPIAGNDSASGRQQNRRVEIIIANQAMVTN